jgi:hypothetical protein
MQNEVNGTLAQKEAQSLSALNEHAFMRAKTILKDDDEEAVEKLAAS